ncbi:MAG: dihydroorotate dehydrogenase, partial [Phycisphaerae bacterium]
PGTRRPAEFAIPGAIQSQGKLAFRAQSSSGASADGACAVNMPASENKRSVIMGSEQKKNVDTAALLRTTLAGIEMTTPILTASGTCGYGPEYADLVDYSLFGGFTTKSVTRHERPGNHPERIVETRAGMLNAIGLANVGVERFIAEKIPFIENMQTKVLVNVAGYNIDDYVHVIEQLDSYACLAGFELNVSCPNVADGLMFGTDPGLMKTVTAAARAAARNHPLIVKLSPNVTDIAPLAQAAVDGGADGLSVINTYVGLSINARTATPQLANITGGLSGPAIKPLALFNVHRVYREVARTAKIPIIGMGGIQTTQDALEFFIAGASAVAVGTALFIDPATPQKIARELAEEVAARGLGNVRELVGTLKIG